MVVEGISLGGAAGGGNGGASAGMDEEVAVDAAAGIVSSASPVFSSRRRRFKKPHGCDCERRMFMDTKFGGGEETLDADAGVVIFAVEAGWRQKVEAVMVVFGRCGANHACKKSASAALCVPKRCTSAMSLREFSAKSSCKKSETWLAACAASSCMVMIPVPLAIATAESSTATSVKLASGSSLSSIDVANVLSMYLMAQSKAASGMFGRLKRSKRSCVEEALGLRTANSTQCRDLVVKYGKSETSGRGSGVDFRFKRVWARVRLTLLVRIRCGENMYAFIGNLSRKTIYNPCNKLSVNVPSAR